MECHSKWNFTEKWMSLKMVTQNGMSLKLECHSKYNVTLNKCHSKRNATQNVMSLKMECYSKL